MTLEIVAGRIAELEKQMEAVMAKMEIVLDDSSSKAMKKTKKEKSAKKEKKAEKEEKPKKKRGMTGYLLFSKENRADVKEEMGDVKPTEVVTEVAKRWKALTDEERGSWNERAKEGAEVEVEVSKD
tara:strand:- start:28 stop:405 length:378 start_codon:yes stop_codon:yes gene_type:complete